MKLCVAFFTSQLCGQKMYQRMAGCIGAVPGVRVRRGGVEGLFSSPKGALEAMLEKSLQPLFTMVGSHGGGGAGVGKEDNRMLCCPAIKACSEQITWPARWEHCSISPSA